MEKILFRSKIQNIESYKLSYLEIYIQGSLDKTTAYKLDKLLKKIKEEKYKKVLFVWKEVNTIDSTGIGILANFNEEFQQQKIELIFLHVQDKIFHLFEMLGLENFFLIFDNYKEAIASFLKNDNEKKFF